MSGVAQVRLYRNTVDAVPADYDDVTAEVLGSSAKSRSAGVESYVGGVVRAGGIVGRTTYFWVELVDGLGRSAGPRPVGSYSRAVERLVPELSAASASNGGHQVTWSSAWSATQTGWKAFDRRNNSSWGGWATGQGSATPHWLAVELPEPRVAAAFRLWSNPWWTESNNALVTFEVQGSNEGGDGAWDTLGAYSDVTYTEIAEADKAADPRFQADLDDPTIAGEVYVFEADLPSPGEYKHYRLFTTTQPNIHVSAGEWVLLG